MPIHPVNNMVVSTNEAPRSKAARNSFELKLTTVLSNTYPAFSIILVSTAARLSQDTFPAFDCPEAVNGVKP